MNKRDLEIKLQKLKGFEDPDPELEQYRIPATTASTVLWSAYMNDDIKGKKVYDLGCGTGTLAIGAKILGASDVVGIDSDGKAVEIAEENAKMMNVDAKFNSMDVSEVEATADTVIQNPPFGSQKKGNDRPFIEKALEVAPVVYSLHLSETEKFIRKFVSDLGAVITDKVTVDFPIERSMSWHDSDVKRINVTLYRFKRS